MFVEAQSAVEADNNQDVGISQSVAITISKGTKAGQFDVWHAGRKLLSGSIDPEFDACRELLASGITGRLTTYWEGKSYPCMRLDIEKAAGYMTDTDKSGAPVFRRYRSKHAV